MCRYGHCTLRALLGTEYVQKDSPQKPITLLYSQSGDWPIFTHIHIANPSLIIRVVPTGLSEDWGPIRHYFLVDQLLG